MPALKRRSDALYAEGQEYEEDSSCVESVQSALRHDSNKKPRLFREHERYGEEDDSESSADAELEELQATQFREKQRRRPHKDNQPADNGVIESVTCTNFMCHGYLEVAVGPLINFVIGHNGSGKSAVLTAITICLGGKASSTNRAGNLKAFIKEGQDACTLSIRLKNGGDTGYQQDIYGDSIIVERHFNKAGTSGFKLRTFNGKIVSTRKADLEDIADYYGLQLDNPMTVLTQDMARQFLNTSTPSDKFKFFVKGVQLEQLAQDYQLLEENVDYIEMTFKDKQDAIEMLRDKATKAKELFTLVEKHDNIRHKVRRLGTQMAWAQVEEQEQYLKSINDDLYRMGETIKRREDKVVVAGEGFDQADAAFETAQVTVQQLTNDFVLLTTEKDAAKEKFDTVKSEASEVQADQRRVKLSMNAGTARIEKFKKEITTEYRRLEELNGENHARRLTEMDQRKARLNGATEHLDEHIAGLPSLEDNKARAVQVSDGYKVPRRSKEAEIQQCKDYLQNLQKEANHNQGGYPVNMSQLIKAIGQDDSFQEKPVGPIGNHIRLLKPIWSAILEQSFGGTLNSFIVTSKQDQNKLSLIMQRVKCPCPILIGNHGTFDFSNNEPADSFLTTLRAVAIDNPLVLRQLIINQGIEQTILIEDASEASRTMNQGRLRNVKQCYALGKDKGQRFTFGYNDMLNLNPVDIYQKIPRMKTDMEVQVSLQQDTLKRLEGELNEIDRQFREAQNAVECSNRAIARHRKRTVELKTEIQAAQSIVDELQDAIDQDAGQEGKLEQLKEFLKEAISDQDTMESQYEELVVARDTHMTKMKECQVEMTAIDPRLEEVDLKKKKQESIAMNLSNLRHLALQDKNSTIQAVAQAKDDKEKLENERTAKAAMVADFSQQANLVGTRIPIDPGDTSAALEKKLTKLNADVTTYERKLGGNKPKIAEEYARATQAYNDALFQFTGEEKLAQLLKKSLVHRRQRWGLFRRYISARAKVMFSGLLSARAFHGKMILNHKEKLLDLNVQPDETRVRQGRQTKTLSGGEKSFSTICLLLALWEAMGAPIRCLDEFDVFMDSVNRDISMKLLVESARGSVGRQFIFITPQSMGALDREIDVKIIRMHDPERNQTTLTFPRA